MIIIKFYVFGIMVSDINTDVSVQLVQISHFQISKIKGNTVFKSLEITYTQRNGVSRQTISDPHKV